MRVLFLKNIQINMIKEEIISKLRTIVKPYVCLLYTSDAADE